MALSNDEEILVAFGIHRNKESPVKVLHHSGDNAILDFVENAALSSIGIHQFDSSCSYELDAYKDTEYYKSHHVAKPIKTTSMTNIAGKTTVSKIHSTGALINSK